MPKTHTVKIISSGPNGFSPAMLRIEPGDSVVWDNMTDMEHTATTLPGQQIAFDITIDPESSSTPQPFPSQTPQSGIEYFCRNHPVMEGNIVAQPQRAPIKLAALDADMSDLMTFPRADWERMARIIGAMWVLDMVDDFLFCKSVHRQEDNEKVANALTAIETWWRTLIGNPSASLTDVNELLQQTPERMEVLGRKLRAEYSALRPLVFRSPQPLRPDDAGGPDVLYPGQSSDEFGKAITVNHASREIQTIEPLEEAMAGPAFFIERSNDRGIPVTPELLKAHGDAKALVLPEHYHILADHQFRGLTRLFGSPTFDEFQIPVRRQTDDRPRRMGCAGVCRVALDALDSILPHRSPNQRRARHVPADANHLSPASDVGRGRPLLVGRGLAV